MRVHFQTHRVRILIVVGLVLLFIAEAYTVRTLNQTAETVNNIDKRTRTIQPICATAGLRRECRTYLRSVDEGRVAGLCKLTAQVLRSSGIEAFCFVPEFHRLPPTRLLPDELQDLINPGASAGEQGSSGGATPGSSSEGATSPGTAPEGGGSGPPATTNPPSGTTPPPSSPSPTPPAGGGGGSPSPQPDVHVDPPPVCVGAACLDLPPTDVHLPKSRR